MSLWVRTGGGILALGACACLLSASSILPDPVHHAVDHHADHHGRIILRRARGGATSTPVRPTHIVPRELEPMPEPPMPPPWLGLPAPGTVPPLVTGLPDPPDPAPWDGLGQGQPPTLDTSGPGGVPAAAPAAPTVTPEPATLVLFGSGLILLGGLVRRRQAG